MRIAIAQLDFTIGAFDRNFHKIRNAVESARSERVDLVVLSENVVVYEVMSTELNTCAPEDGIIEAAQQMLESRQRRRPVVDNGRLVGQVSSKTVLWALMENTRRNQ